jgi:hypothetical protein
MFTSAKYDTGVKLTFAAVCMVSIAGYFGCAKGDANKGKASADHAHDAHADHDHGAEGPHHGQLIELGDEFHAELVHDDANQKVTVYLLDGTAKAGLPIEATEITLNLVLNEKPTQYQLKAAPEGNDGAGKSSKFELADKGLSDGLDAEGAKARVSVNIGGKPYIGFITSHEHGHDHDHDHGHEQK